MGTPRRRTAASVALAVAMTATFAACGGSDEPPDATGGEGERPASTAELTIVSPENGSVVTGTTVDVRVDLEGGMLVPQTSKEIVPDEGHLHVLLDGELVSMTEGTEQEVGGLTAGLHRIQVEFVAADHAPFDPRVVVVSAFTVES